MGYCPCLLKFSSFICFTSITSPARRLLSVLPSCPPAGVIRVGGTSLYFLAVSVAFSITFGDPVVLFEVHSAFQARATTRLACFGPFYLGFLTFLVLFSRRSLVFSLCHSFVAFLRRLCIGSLEWSSAFILALALFFSMRLFGFCFCFSWRPNQILCLSILLCLYWGRVLCIVSATAFFRLSWFFLSVFSFPARMDL